MVICQSHYPTISRGNTYESVEVLHPGRPPPNGAGHLAKQQLRVLYLDWELDEGEHRLRYEQIFGEAMPTELFYWRCDRHLPQINDAIRQKIAKLSVDFVVVDSIGYACPGNITSAEAATTYANLVRTWGVGSLHLAHMVKGTKNNESAKMKPFGSVFWHASARSICP